MAAVEAPLGGDVRRGLAWSGLNSVVSRLGQVVVGIVLARLLVPAEFGVFAVALVAYTVIISCSEMGVTVSLVRSPGDGARLGPTVTTLALASSVALMAVSWVAAPAFSRALNAPEATSVLRVLTLAILIAGISAVPTALVQRDFQQKARFAADSVSLVVSTAVAVLGVLAGGGAMALAWSRVAGNLASAVVLTVAARERYRPGFDRRVAKELLTLGLPLTGASLLTFALLNVDYIVIGGMWGPAVLGVYVLAFNLSGWPVAAFSQMARSVALPAFARLRTSKEGVAEAFRSALALLLTASLLVSVLLAVLAEPLIHVVYGSAWAAAAVPLVFLASLGTFRVVHELAYDYLVAVGRGRAVMGIQAAWFVSLLILLPVGARIGGIRGVGVGHLVAAVGIVLPLYAVALRAEGVPTRTLVRTFVRPLTGAALAAAAAGLFLLTVGHPVAELVLGGAVGGFVYLVVVGPDLPAQLWALSPRAWVSRLTGRTARRRAAGLTL